MVQITPILKVLFINITSGIHTKVITCVHNVSVHSLLLFLRNEIDLNCLIYLVIQMCQYHVSLPLAHFEIAIW